MWSVLFILDAIYCGCHGNAFERILNRGSSSLIRAALRVTHTDELF